MERLEERALRIRHRIPRHRTTPFEQSWAACLTPRRPEEKFCQHGLGTHLQDLDVRAESIHPRFDAWNTETKHLKKRVDLYMVSHVSEDIMHALDFEFHGDFKYFIRRLKRRFLDSSVLLIEGNTLDFAFEVDEEGKKNGVVVLWSVLDDFEPTTLRFNDIIEALQTLSDRKRRALN